jgi:hypothetical protein
MYQEVQSSSKMPPQLSYSLQLFTLSVGQRLVTPALPQQLHGHLSAGHLAERLRKEGGGGSVHGSKLEAGEAGAGLEIAKSLVQSVTVQLYERRQDMVGLEQEKLESIYLRNAH